MTEQERHEWRLHAPRLSNGELTFRGDGRLPDVKRKLLVERVKRLANRRWPLVTVHAELYGKDSRGLRLTAMYNPGKKKPPITLLNRAMLARKKFPDEEEEKE